MSVTETNLSLPTKIWLRVLATTRLASQIVLAVMLLAICYDVVMRALFNLPTNWSIEVNAFLVVFIATIGAAGALHDGSHIRMNYFEGLMPERVRSVVYRLHSVLGVAFCAILVWRGGLVAWQSWEHGERVSSALGTPLFIPNALLPIGFGLLGVQFLLHAFVPPKE